MKLLIAYDGSDYGRGAFPDLKLAGLPDVAEAIVLSAADVILPPTSEPGDETSNFMPESLKLARLSAERALMKADATAKHGSELVKNSFPRWQVSHEALADSPAWAVIRRSDEWKPDLIVVGARGHSLLGGRLILGSVSQRVLYEARCSVRISRTRRETKNGVPVRIVIGVDNSTYSRAAVDAVAQRKWAAGTEIRLLAVVDTVMAVGPEPTGVKWIEVGAEKDWQQVRQLFAPLVDQLNSAGLRASLMIRKGDPKEEIVAEADGWNADSIFVGAKGLRGIERLLLGSVSSAVSARAHCSVEVVRPR
jgi:nucleotide-binding universal stress UspA family protein